MVGAACAVRDVTVESSRDTILSRIIRLRLAYEGPGPFGPASIIFKTSHPERTAAGWNGGRQEVAFYAEIAPGMPTGLVPGCYDAACDEETRTWHLLLEDLSETHSTAGDWPLPPSLLSCERIVEAHARIQAANWDGTALDGPMQTWRWRDDASASQSIERLAAQVSQFVDRMDDRLPVERRDFFARLVDAAPRLAGRYLTRRNLTVVQGDAHVWNCFLPRDGGHDIRFFDWDSWRVDVGASDLAYLMAIHWYPDRRRRIERLLLDRYHEALTARGVAAYDRRALDDDYRFAVLWQTTWPLSQEAYGIPPVIWWNNLERILMAADDLGCAELIAT